MNLDTTYGLFTIQHAPGVLTHHNVTKETEKAICLESDNPFCKKIASWVPKAWFAESTIKGVYKIKPWVFTKLTKYQEVSLGLREL